NILDLVDIAADEERLEVFLDGRLHHAGALGERRAPQPVKARLTGQDLDDDQPDAIGGGEDRRDVGDFQRGQAAGGGRGRLRRGLLRAGRTGEEAQSTGRGTGR